jgi:hypothetical protein
MDSGITPLTLEQEAGREASAAQEGYLHRVTEDADVDLERAQSIEQTESSDPALEK